MEKIINHLRTYRKNTSLTQYDISLLLYLKGNTIVSRCEKGFRAPNLEMFVLYHLLFDTPIPTLISNHIDIIKEQLISRIPEVISEIKQDESSTNAQSRINFLQDVLTRLSSKHNEK